jgi:hypothetical protein
MQQQLTITTACTATPSSSTPGYTIDRLDTHHQTKAVKGQSFVPAGPDATVPLPFTRMESQVVRREFTVLSIIRETTSPGERVYRADDHNNNIDN